MLINARTLPTGETIETEICIVGASPAGITLAREFTSADFRVCLLESGGLEFDPNTQSLSQGESGGNLFGSQSHTLHSRFSNQACRPFEKSYSIAGSLREVSVDL